MSSRASVLFRIGLLACIQAGFLLAIKSQWLEQLLGQSFIAPLHYGTEPMQVTLVILVCIACLTLREKQPKLQYHSSQIMFGLIGVLIIAGIGLYMTHYSPWFREHITGNTGNAPVVSAISALRYTWLMVGLIPLALFLIPWPFLKIHRAIFVFGFLTLIGYMWLGVLRIGLHEPLGFAVLYLAGTVLLLISDQVLVQPEVLKLQYEQYSAHIGPPCLGLDGIALLMILWSFIWYFKAQQQPVPHLRMATLLLLGSMSLMLLNIVRIAALMIVGNYSPDFALDLFHSSIGGVLFLGVFFAMVKAMNIATFHTHAAH